MDIHNEFTYRHGSFAPALLIITILLLASCKVTKQVSTSRVNTDSLVSEEKRKLTEVHQKETDELRKMIEEMTSSGVTFVVDSCPERDAVLALLDSTGRANYEKARLQDRVKSLSNKVTISERGLITAEGNIKEARFTSSKLQEELFRSEKTIDSLQAELQNKDTHVETISITKDKDVKRTSPIPWIFFLLACSASAFVGWWARGKIKESSTQTWKMPIKQT